MGLFLVFILLFVLGIIIYKLTYDDTLEITAIFSFVIGAIGLVISSLMLLIIKAEQKQYINVTYPNIISIIDQTSKNKYITGSERTDVLKLAIQHNQNVLGERYWVDSFWIGAFNSEQIANLPLIDLSKIKKANSKITIVEE